MAAGVFSCSSSRLTEPETAIAATAVARLLGPPSAAQERHAKLGTILAHQPGHLTHVLFRGFDDPAVLGAFSHWQDATALDKAIAALNALDPMEVLPELVHLQYEPLRT